MSDIATYSFKDVAISLGGTDLIDGFDEGDDAIRIRPRAQHFDLKTGADGAGTIYQNADRSAELILKLQQTSKSNALITKRLVAQYAGILNPFAFAAIDMFGGDVATAESAVVSGPAEFVRGTAPNTVEWTLILHNADILNIGIPG